MRKTQYTKAYFNVISTLTQYYYNTFTVIVGNLHMNLYFVKDLVIKINV